MCTFYVSSHREMPGNFLTLKNGICRFQYELVMKFMEEKKQQLDIELDHDIAQGTYANLAVISHSSSEFIVDFIRIMPGLTKAEVKSRIILTPEHAKRLLLALQDNIRRYEQLNGKISLPEESQASPIFPLNLETQGQA